MYMLNDRGPKTDPIETPPVWSFQELKDPFTLTLRQGRRKHLKLGGTRHFEGTFFLKKKGACSKCEKGTSLFKAKSWGHVPPVPPGSYVSELVHNLLS